MKEKLVFGVGVTDIPGLIRHATPEEIAAGHRIDNDIGDDSHIENHISPLCKMGVK